MKKFWRFAMFFVCGIYLCLLIFFSLSYFGYKHITIPDYIEDYSVIAIYGTDNNDMIYKEASELLKKHKDMKLIITPFVVNEKVNSAALMKKYGISKEKVIPDYYSTNKKSSMSFVSKELYKRKLDNVLIIANDYEMRNLKLVFEKIDSVHFIFNKSIQNDHDSKQYKINAQNELKELPLILID